MLDGLIVFIGVIVKAFERQCIYGFIIGCQESDLYHEHIIKYVALYHETFTYLAKSHIILLNVLLAYLL